MQLIVILNLIDDALVYTCLAILLFLIIYVELGRLSAGSHCSEGCCPTFDRDASIPRCTTEGDVSLCIGATGTGLSLFLFFSFLMAPFRAKVTSQSLLEMNSFNFTHA